ncbi:hypothetical protein ACFLZX_04875 [Nanoarchaeota archaeon]
MFRKKIYGQSRVEKCPFCDKIGTLKNKQGLPVCQAHKNKMLMDIKCVCGEYLDIRTGKWGPYFYCNTCGNINLKKGLEMNPPKKDTPKEITVRSDQLDSMF